MTSRPVILLSLPAYADWDGLPPAYDIRRCGPGVAELNAAFDDSVEILVTEFMPEATEPAAGLRWIQVLSAGTEQLLGHPLVHPALRLSNAAGVSSTHMAEFVLGRILEHRKRLPAFRELQARHEWPADRPAMATHNLRGARALIIGYGGVGRETARLLSACGMRIVAVDRSTARAPYPGFVPFEGTGDPEARIPERIVALKDVDDALPDADFVILTVSLNRATRHVINARTLTRMNPGAVLINVARGGLVDTAALLASLDAGALAHACLDAFTDEPLPADSPIWTHPRISVSPHMSGVLPDQFVLLQGLFLQNLERYRAGAALLNELPPRDYVEAS